MKHCDKIPLVFFIWFCLCVLGLLIAKADFVCLGNHSVGGNSCITGIGKGATAQQAKDALVGDTGQEIPTVTWRCAGNHVAFTGAFLGRYRWTSTDASGRQYTAYYCSRCDFGIASTPYIITKNVVAYPLNAVIPDWASTSPYFDYSHGSPVFDDFGGVTGISGAVLTPPVNPATGQPSVAGSDGDWTFAADGEPTWNSYRTSAGAVNMDAPVVAPSDGLNNDYIKQMGDKLDNSLDYLRGKLDDVYDYSAGLDSRIGSIDSSIGSLGSAVGGLQSSVGGLSSSMSDLQAAVGSVGAGVSGLYGSLNDVRSGVNNVGASVGGLQVGIDGVASAVSANGANIDGLTTQVLALKSTVNSNISSLSPVLQDILEANQAIQLGQNQWMLDVQDKLLPSVDSLVENVSDWSEDYQAEQLKVTGPNGFFESILEKVDNLISSVKGLTNLFVSASYTNNTTLYITNAITISDFSTNSLSGFYTNNISISVTNDFGFATSGDVSSVIDNLPDVAIPSDLQDATDNYIDFLTRVITWINDFGSSVKPAALRLVGQYKNLPRTKPNVQFTITLPQIWDGGTFTFRLNDYITEDFWRWILFARSCEVLGLGCWFTMLSIKTIVRCFRIKVR